MSKGEKLYEGKAKILYATDDPQLVIQYFKDDATAFNAQKRGTIVDKGVVNNQISAHLFALLEREGVPTHFVKQLSDREMLVKRLGIIPLEVTIRNIVAGGMAKMLGLEEGIVLAQPVFEWHYKSDALGDPLINDDHIFALGAATADELGHIRAQSHRVNDVLKRYFLQRGIDLVDFKLEFGRFPIGQGKGNDPEPSARERHPTDPSVPGSGPHTNIVGVGAGRQGTILLGDEISPDTCRFWEQGTKRKLDKDRFRRDLGDVEAAYQEMLNRVVGTSARPSGVAR